MGTVCDVGLAAGLLLIWQVGPGPVRAIAPGAARSTSVADVFLSSAWLTSSPQAGPDPTATIYGPPPNVIGGHLQSLLESMWRDSPTFRRQCVRIAAATSLTVTLRTDFTRTRATVRATTTFTLKPGGLTADVILFGMGDEPELVAHEVEHVIERLDGARLQGDECGSPSESCRAVEAGRRVAREVSEARRARRPGRGVSGRLSF
jgi:hypothetical protein